MRHNGRTLVGYVGSRELSDGRLFEVKWTSAVLEGCFDHEEESDDDDECYYLDGKLVDWEELPPEVTVALIDELITSAEEDPTADFGFPD